MGIRRYGETCCSPLGPRTLLAMDAPIWYRGAVERTDGPLGSSRRSPRGTPSKGSSSSRSAIRKGSTSGFPPGTAHSPLPTSPLARSRSSPTASTRTRAAGRSSPSTDPKNCCGSKTWDRHSCVGHSGRCRNCRRANYGPPSVRHLELEREGLIDRDSVEEQPHCLRRRQPQAPPSPTASSPRPSGRGASSCAPSSRPQQAL